MEVQSSFRMSSRAVADGTSTRLANSKSIEQKSDMLSFSIDMHFKCETFRPRKLYSYSMYVRIDDLTDRMNDDEDLDMLLCGETGLYSERGQMIT